MEMRALSLLAVLAIFDFGCAQVCKRTVVTNTQPYCFRRQSPIWALRCVRPFSNHQYRPYRYYWRRWDNWHLHRWIPSRSLYREWIHRQRFDHCPKRCSRRIQCNRISTRIHNSNRKSRRQKSWPWHIQILYFSTIDWSFDATGDWKL